MRKALASICLALILLAPASAAALRPATARAATEPTRAEKRVIAAINEQRAAAGLAKLRFRVSLTNAARAHVRDIAAREVLTHVSDNGWTLVERVRHYGYSAVDCSYWKVGETLACATAGTAAARPRAIVALWMLSAAHRDILLTPRFRDIGVGIVRGDDGMRYFTVDVGRRVKS